MTPRERILATLNRQPVDQPPVDLWCTGEVLDALRVHTGEQDELAVYRALGLDKIVWIFPGYAGRHFDPNDSGGTNLWGVPTRMVRAGAATYQEFGLPPLGACESPGEITGYDKWPDPELFDYEGCRASAMRARDFGFATIGPWISHFEVYCQMRGLENALMDVAADPDMVEAGLDEIDRVQTVLLENMLNRVGDLMDIVFISDDMGTQNSLLVSLKAWERHFQPRLARWCDLIHRHGKKVLFHTDGAVRQIIPGLIDCGIDIFNPIQHVCPGMELDALARDFGSRIIFHGGVDNQNVLPFGSPGDVRGEVRNCRRTLGANGGGYICCSCHNAQAGTPVENILAMISAAREEMCGPS